MYINFIVYICTEDVHDHVRAQGKKKTRHNQKYAQLAYYFVWTHNKPM